MSLVAVDAFAGAGGLSLGLRDAGWQVAFAFDHDPIAVATYARNIGPDVRTLDAETTSAAEIARLTGLTPGACDLLAGGPPCQGFSLQRRGPSADARSQLVLRFVDLIVAMRPKSFLMENVPAIGSKRGRDILTALTLRTSDLGYVVYETTLDAADYGVAQHRRRTFIVGIDSGRPRFRWPSPTTLTRRRTVREALDGLPSPPSDGSPHPSVPNHYREARLSVVNLERIKHIPQGGGREHLPAELQLPCHANGHRHLDTYGRLAWDLPAATITARFDSFTRGRFGHPEEHRSITLREGARLQGFPDWFVFLGSREDGARMIGNAVPPPLARAVGQSIRVALEGGDESAVMPRPALPATAQVPLEL